MSQGHNEITVVDSYFISLDIGLDSHLTRLDYQQKKKKEDPLSSQQKTLLIITMRK